MDNHEGPTPDKSPVELMDNSLVGSSFVLNTRTSGGEIGKVPTLAIPLCFCDGPCICKRFEFEPTTSS